MIEFQRRYRHKGGVLGRSGYVFVFRLRKLLNKSPIRPIRPIRLKSKLRAFEKPSNKNWYEKNLTCLQEFLADEMLPITTVPVRPKKGVILWADRYAVVNTIAEGLGFGATPNGGIHIFIIRNVNQAEKKINPILLYKSPILSGQVTKIILLFLDAKIQIE